MTYTKDQLRAAKSDYRSGISLREASRRHQVPVEVLERAIKDGSIWSTR